MVLVVVEVTKKLEVLKMLLIFSHYLFHAAGYTSIYKASTCTTQYTP
jgi:hypothetical protein